MSQYKQAVCWGGFAGKVDAPTFLKAVAEIGFQGVEMLPEEHWAQARDLGLDLVTIIGHGTIDGGLNRKENHTRIADELHRSIETAREWNIPHLIVFSGNRDGVDDEQGLEACAEGLSLIAGEAERNGVNLCMELLNSKVDHPGYQYDHTAWGRRLCEMVNSPNVKLLYDIYHMQIMEGDIIRTLRDNMDHIAHIHTAGNPGRQDLDDEQEINYVAVAKALADMGYRGFVGHEFSPKKDWRAALEQAFDRFALR